MKNSLKHLSWILVLTVFSCSKYPGPLSPEQALDSFELHPDFEIEVFAAEPFVKDPVCMEFDADGNVYVVEMYDYPYRPEEGEERGRIVQLRDEDGDGEVDASTVFADKLMEATSILPWKGGLIVTSAPNILYLKDTDGDGKADVKEVLFSGFFAANSEAQITSLRFGADNWIYASNNGRSGEVSSPLDPDAPVLEMSGADFRFRLDKDVYEQISGSGQFGQDIDEFGHRYFTQNTLHIQQSIMPWQYWHRHSYMPSFRTSENISDHELEMFQLTPPPYWRAERTDRRNADYQERNLDRVEYAEDKFTGASGGTIFTGRGFGDAFDGNVFTGDVAGNLVHRDILHPDIDGPAMIARRAEGEKDQEFLASSDSWFRPTNFAQGPDGMLYVLDYYRQHIETPLSIPDDLKEEMDFMNGSDKGRIYRIKPKGAVVKPSNVNLTQYSTEQLVPFLGHPNGWYRSTAQRLILERQEKGIIDQVRTMYLLSNNPKLRLRSLYTLEGLDALAMADIQRALGDPDPGIRKQALLLAEKLDNGLELALPSAQDPDARVAFQAALTIGNYQGEDVQNALADVLKRFGNRWYVWAVLSSEVGSSLGFFDQLLDNGYFNNLEDSPVFYVENYAFITGAKNDVDQLKGLLTSLQKKPFADNAEVMGTTLDELFDGLQKSDMTDEMKERVKKIAEDDGINQLEKVKSLSTIF
ncbi:MAG: PVC-type heme-binding CxxCH protein [Bacteroidota bacterium]